ncbi:hypothetical protein QAD02_012588 [Eretmocerus hayati]|uniref:Uncharacterized protein n=1 Tax=Eretmocerus hayati TaxID=131215 RepID=A0ACC2P161_9HYME|nr:hypothetical protein QAD02_012588 [Eretmocerus hayati]
MVERWPNVARLIVDYAHEKSSKRNKKDVELEGRLKKWSWLPQNTQALLLLPVVFDASKVPNSKIKKDNIDRCFFDFIQFEEKKTFEMLLELSQQSLNKLVGKKESTITPRVVLHGKNVQTARPFVVLTESTYYKASDLIEAVDSCYKVIKGLYMISKFGKPIPHVWCFLEKFVYEIHDEHDGYKGVDILIGNLERIRDFKSSIVDN